MPPLTAAIVLSVLLMGGIGGFVVLPIVCINWAWNVFIVHYAHLPVIEIWQACLLYLALACVAYLSGFLQIEFSAETVD
jgi:hypothetical protein